MFVNTPKENAYNQSSSTTCSTSRIFDDFRTMLASGIDHLAILTQQTSRISRSSHPRPEQTAIAEVLSDMDAEIAALEQRLAKTRALKQGMMQELLTGKTRFV